MVFSPNPRDELIIDGVAYRIAEHPAAPGFPYGQEGRAGIVYCLQNPATASKAALKVFKPRFRSPFLVAQADRMAPFAALPGLRACRRTVLTPFRHADLLRQHPDLTYAVLMPWIQGPTWFDILMDRKPLPPETALSLAHSLTQVLARMEEQGIAHCDLSAPNVMLPLLAGGAGVELVDLEGLYAPGMPQPQELSSGSAGYAHPQAAGGLWSPEADRFAGAVLLAEMLGWCDPQVVQAAWGESYFDPAEMQQQTPRYRTLVTALERRWGSAVAALFERAWRSDTLADCPTFGEWLVALPEQPPIGITRVVASPEPRKEERFAALTPVEAAAEIRALMQAARRMEDKGGPESALELYRQALGLAQAHPSLRSLAREIERIIQDAKKQHEAEETRRKAEEQAGRKAEEETWRRAKEQARWEWEGQVRRAEEERHRKHRTPIWALGGLALLLLTLGGLWILGRMQRIPGPVAAISPENADRVAQLARWGRGRIRQAAFSPDGRLLAVASSLGISIYDAGTLEEVRSIETEAWVRSIAFSPDGRTLASEAGDNIVRLWQVSRGASPRALSGHAAWVNSVAFSPDGQTLASGSDDRTVRLWRASDGALLRTLEGHSAPVRSVAFSPDGQTLASGSDDHTVRLWRASDGALLRTLEGHSAPVRSVAFSPDGQTLASGSDDHTVRLWRASDGALLRTLEGHSAPVRSVAFSPDGQTLASGSDDHTVRLWRASDGALLRTLEGHSAPVWSVAFSPDGRLLASGSDDGTVRLWGVKP
jgi:uncharacterized protein with WD repeat